MAATKFDAFRHAVDERATRIYRYLTDEKSVQFDYQHLEDAVLSYVRAGGKALRPAVMMFACGAVGGDESHAIPAAAAVELYHTYTLVHDDIIDRDEMRRNVPTVHTEFAKRGRDELAFDEATAAHYGLSLAILAGDMQQGWAVSLMPALTQEHGVSAELTLNLIYELFNRVQRTLVNGETVDVLLAETPVDQVSEKQILNMLWQKTGILYEYCGRAGAAIGLDEPDLQHETVDAIAKFTGRCGIAFQIQDDVLGIVGDESKLGKSVGNDIREGKRTLVLTGTLPQLSSSERDFLMSVLGNQDAGEDDIHEALDLMRNNGGVDHAKAIAERYVAEARAHLDPLPESDYKDWLLAWSDFILERAL